MLLLRSLLTSLLLLVSVDAGAVDYNDFGLVVLGKRISPGLLWQSCDLAGVRTVTLFLINNPTPITMQMQWGDAGFETVWPNSSGQELSTPASQPQDATSAAGPVFIQWPAYGPCMRLSEVKNPGGFVEAYLGFNYTDLSAWRFFNPFQKHAADFLAAVSIPTTSTQVVASSNGFRQRIEVYNITSYRVWCSVDHPAVQGTPSFPIEGYAQRAWYLPMSVPRGALNCLTDSNAGGLASLSLVVHN